MKYNLDNLILILLSSLPLFFTASEYDNLRKSDRLLPTLQTLRKHDLVSPVYAEEKWLQDEDGYPVKVRRYYYKAND